MEVFWKDTEKTILIRESPETWVWEEYERGVQKMYELLQEVSHDVYIIIDARRVQSVPRDALSHFSSANQRMPPHVVMRILVSKNTLILALKSLLQKMIPENFENFYFLGTIEEAYEKIAKEQAKRQEK